MLDFGRIFGLTNAPAVRATPADPTEGTDTAPLLDVAAYVAEHGCYPPGGVGKAGGTERWYADQAADGFRRWRLRPDARGVWGWERADLADYQRWWARVDYDHLPKPGAIQAGYLGDPRERRGNDA